MKYRRPQPRDYFRLKHKDLMQFARMGIGEQSSFKHYELATGELEVSMLITRKESSLDFRDRRKRKNLEVPLLATQLTYGWRWWVACPECERRCALLYYSNSTYQHGLYCRKCLGLRYECQNGRKEGYLVRKEQELLERFWPGDKEQYNFDEEFYPKPKTRWYRTFQQDMEKYREVEACLQSVKDKNDYKFQMKCLKIGLPWDITFENYMARNGL